MKEVYLTIEEWQRLAATTPLERKRALGQLKRWVTYEIIRRKFSLEYGPFSCAAASRLSASFSGTAFCYVTVSLALFGAALGPFSV